MNRSRTYNPTTSRCTVFPAPPAQAYTPAGRTQRYGSIQKPTANGQRPIAKIQHPTTNPQFPTPRWTHTFSAKEKDSETGFSYFGSRYYSSDLSIWLSVDPMSGKYPHQSSYVYCGNNPIKTIDPTGEDEWEVNENTGLIKHYSNDKPDKLYVTSLDGKRKENIEPLDVDRTIMNAMTSDGTYSSFCTMDKRNEINKMFDFFADNTYVEWTHVGASFDIESSSGVETKNVDLLFTRHQNVSCNMRGSLEDFASGGRLDFHKHSHPNKYTGDNPYYALMYPITSHIPSRSDVQAKNDFIKTPIPLKLPFFLLRNGKRNIYY